MVKIRKPSRDNDNVRNVAGYFSRKGFYAVNCQVIVDKKKRILWRSIKCRGGEHDSNAFKKTKLYEQLVNDYQTFIQNGFYLIGDSAYALASFLLKPFDGATPYSDEDSFNFFLSSSRIYVECCFGEIDGRWGILWKPLAFSLGRNLAVIDAVMRLHNFIVDYRERTNEDVALLVQSEMHTFNLEAIAALRDSDDLDNDVFIGVHSNDSTPPANVVGRPNNIEVVIRDYGASKRKALCQMFKERKMTRPDRHGTSKLYMPGQFGRVQIHSET